MKALKKKIPERESVSTRGYQAEKHLRKFCSVTSQELSHVLGALVGELDYALSSSNALVRDRSMRVALSAAERAQTLARNLRYFAVHTRLDAQIADVSQIVLDTLDLIEKDLEARGIQLSVLVEASAYAVIDTGAFQQILLNLLSNASHAMPQGGKLTLSLRHVKRGIEVRCIDTGVGIAPEDLDRVFEPYFIASDAHLLSESQGLGLAVAKALIEAHGGEIMVESRLGAGTTFTLHVPAELDMPAPEPFREKRRYRRVAVTLPVEISWEDQPIVPSELTILSVGGCFIRLPGSDIIQKLEPNQNLALRIIYFGRETISIARARVASLCRVGAHSGIGVEFLDLEPKAKKLLAAIVKSHAS